MSGGEQKTISSFTRQEDVGQLAALLNQWATSYGLPLKRVKSCAYGTIVAIPDNVSFDAPLSVNLACHELWIYALDGFIDKLDFDRLNGTQAKVQFLDRLLSHIVWPFYQDGKADKTAFDFGNASDDFLALSNDQRTTVDLEKQFGEALHNLYLSLLDAWTQINPNYAQYNLEHFTFQSAKQVEAMRREIVETIRNNERRKVGTPIPLPTLEDYLAGASISIAIPCLTATVSTFDTDPPKTAKECQFATTLVARSIRLANDYGSYGQEIEEGKVSAVTIALAKLGYDTNKNYGPESTEIVKARQLVKKWLEPEKNHFETIKDYLPENLTSSFLKATQQSSLIAYDKGDFVIPV